MKKKNDLFNTTHQNKLQWNIDLVIFIIIIIIVFVCKLKL